MDNSGKPAIELLAPTQFQAVPFLDKTIDCFLIDNDVYVVVNSIIDAVGLHPDSAKSWLRKDEILSQGVVSLAPPSAKYQGQKASCISLEFVPGWLFSININRTKAEVKSNLLAFRRDAHKVLFNHYFGEATKVSTGMKRKLEIDLKIKANNQEIKRLTSINEGIKALKDENQALLKEKKSINNQFSGQLGLNFDLIGKEDSNNG